MASGSPTITNSARGGRLTTWRTDTGEITRDKGIRSVSGGGSLGTSKARKRRPKNTTNSQKRF